MTSSMFITSPDLQSLVQDAETLAAAEWFKTETCNTEINDAQTHVWLTSCGKSILWSISLQAISTFRAQGLIKNSGGEVCDCFFKKSKEVLHWPKCGWAAGSDFLHSLCVKMKKLRPLEKHFPRSVDAQESIAPSGCVFVPNSCRLWCDAAYGGNKCSGVAHILIPFYHSLWQTFSVAALNIL